MVSQLAYEAILSWEYFLSNSVVHLSFYAFIVYTHTQKKTTRQLLLVVVPGQETQDSSLPGSFFATWIPQQGQLKIYIRMVMSLLIVFALGSRPQSVGRSMKLSLISEFWLSCKTVSWSLALPLQSISGKKHIYSVLASILSYATSFGTVWVTFAMTIRVFCF